MDKQSDEYRDQLKSQMKDGELLVRREILVDDKFSWEWTIASYDGVTSYVNVYEGLVDEPFIYPNSAVLFNCALNAQQILELARCEDLTDETLDRIAGKGNWNR